MDFTCSIVTPPGRLRNLTAYCLVREYLKVERHARWSRIVAISFVDGTSIGTSIGTMSSCVGSPSDFFWRLGEAGILFALREEDKEETAERDLRGGGMLQVLVEVWIRLI